MDRVDYFEGCDEFAADDYTPCYISREREPADATSTPARSWRTRSTFPTRSCTARAMNSSHTPALLARRSGSPNSATDSASTPTLATSTTRTRSSDQWSEAARYLHTFTRPENPAHVVYKRDMPFEIATEEVQSGGADLDFDFDSAYWMSGLSPVDEAAGRLVRRSQPGDPRESAPGGSRHRPSGVPGQTGPYVITGLQWIDDPTAPASQPANAFDATLTGADAVTLDVARMALDISQTIVGTVSTGSPLSLSLDGDWSHAPPHAPTVSIDGTAVPATVSRGTLTFEVPAGNHAIEITPSSKGKKPRP